MTTEKTFDMMLGKYCGPALAGIKPANMICVKKERLPLFKTLLKDYNNNMNRYDIYFSVINETETCYILLVYRRTKLMMHLNNLLVKEQLIADGYPNTNNLAEQINMLRKRFVDSSTPPDEIGLFLGYPMEDVLGFKENRGKGCLMAKYWKVYANVNETQKLFDRYDRCKAALINRISRGVSIIDIFTKTVA